MVRFKLVDCEIATALANSNGGQEHVINLSVVACGDRVPETVTLLKSALMFTKKKLFFYIFTEPDLKDLFKQQVIISCKTQGSNAIIETSEIRLL